MSRRLFLIYDQSTSLTFRLRARFSGAKLEYRDSSDTLVPIKSQGDWDVPRPEESPDRELAVAGLSRL